MDGITATRRIREIESTTGTHVPIIGTSANCRTQQIDDMLQAGMVSYIYLITF